jgi:nucleoside-diphosphate-sugar epimerase
MKVLFIGGTGNISAAVSHLAIDRGIELTLLTRGSREQSIPGAEVIQCSIGDEAMVDAALHGRTFDAVVDWIAFTPEDIERDLRLFRRRASQFVFISSASCYQKPVQHYLITEKTPLENPFWEYSRLKIACEQRLWRAQAEEQFPVTIVRPSLTYGDTILPLPTNSWYPYAFTVIDRMRRGKKVVIPGDGTSLWVLTHNSDFAKGILGLLGNPKAIGEAFHITSDEVLTWNQIYTETAAAVGVEPNFIHIASEYIARFMPEKFGSLIGDKSNSVVFDNSKIKAAVPGFAATKTWAQGVRETIEWFDADRSRQLMDQKAEAEWDRLIESYESSIRAASESFKRA